MCFPLNPECGFLAGPQLAASPKGAKTGNLIAAPSSSQEWGMLGGTFSSPPKYSLIGLGEHSLHGMMPVFSLLYVQNKGPGKAVVA